MKRKVKKYAGGTLVDSSGNPVRSGSGEPVRTRFGKDDEERPMSSGVEDYASMGKRASASSPFGGPKEYISESIKEDTEKETESPKGIASGFKSSEPKFERNDNEITETKKSVIKKKPAGEKAKDPSRILDALRAQRELEKEGPAKIGNQSFGIKPEEKKVPPLRKIGEAIMGTMESANKPYRSSMYDKMKGRKAGGSIKMASGGKTSSASSRGDGIAQRGKTKGRIC